MSYLSKALHALQPGPIDHDHATGKVRSILCFHCNVGIGMLRESEFNLARAAAYLKWTGNTTHEKWMGVRFADFPVSYSITSAHS